MSVAWVEVHGQSRDDAPTKDKSYLAYALGPAVSDYLDQRESEGLAERTRDTYERDLARLARLTDPKPIDEITTDDLFVVLSTWPLPSRKRARSSFRAFFERCRKRGLLIHDPALDLPAIRLPQQPIIDIFDGNEQQRLKTLPTEIRDRALTTLLLETGLRKSEARALTVADLDLAGGKLSVRRGKGNKGRVVPLLPPTCSVLAELLLTEGLERHDHLWYVRRVIAVRDQEIVTRDKTLGDGGFHRWWIRMCDESNVRYRNAHVCRHTYATTLLNRGVSMQSVQRLLGHASIKTTVDIYAHLSVNDLVAELEMAFDLERMK